MDETNTPRALIAVKQDFVLYNTMYVAKRGRLGIYWRVERELVGYGASHMLIAVPDCCMACMGLVARVLLADGSVGVREMMGNGGLP